MRNEPTSAARWAVIEREAAHWFVRLQADYVTSEDQIEFGLWLAEDSAHLACFEEIERSWNDVPTPELAAHHDDVISTLSRQKFASGIVARLSSRTAVRTAWISPIILAFAMMAVLIRPGTIYVSDEQAQFVTLSDATRITLSPNSKIRVVYWGDQRVVDVLAGGASFDVSDDPARRFVVWTNGGRLDATDSEFAVALVADGTQVSVQGGLVRLTTAAPTLNGTVFAESMISAGEERHFFLPDLNRLAGLQGLSGSAHVTGLTPAGTP
ncbi:FecR domain-containing protein [Erythrobacter sp. AP23]|uniref:FecR family protein n=1 Tax=Erythrobacter sp. AP23 TaxID=499656 RepID=UPI00076C7D79|nr:FecR domain-containing protein [Erythrobacter sp. AP23]KWV93785.1 hypothetical protein ASS64_12890 [Erythrobacter sp. AP23]